MGFDLSVPKQGIFDFQDEFCIQKQLLSREFALLQLLINGFKTRRRGIVLCPKQDNKIEGVVLSGVCIL